MVKKLVLQVSRSSSICDTRDEDTTPLFILNQCMYDIVTQYKDMITEYYKNRSWDRFKKLSNEYEHIFYSPNASGNISLYNPVSRSFFKLWEILHDYESQVLLNVPMKCVFLAEGPGGFFEAFYKKRKDAMKDKEDQYYGMTLKSNNNRNIPDWKMNKQFPLNISYGKDGTGNLYSLENREYFIDEVVGRGSVDFITADGGFDFSSDFNNQEEQSLRLVASEIMCCIGLQKVGGCFLLKVYDCFNKDTMMMVQALAEIYEELHFIKPLTSRPANSERYVLCMGFKGGVPNTLLTYLEDIIEERDTSYMQSWSYDIIYSIILYNLYYTIRQVQYIQRTITYINFFTTTKSNTDDIMKNLLDKHSNKSKKWCIKYKIPYKE